ncbi:MAG: ribonucleoside-diphosphate reductase, partial [Sphingobacteriales bacterium]
MKDQEIKALEHTEPILAERGNKKYILGAQPQYPDLWSSYVKQKRAFWDVDSVDLSKDILDWKHKLNDDERHFLSYVLAFFASSDSIVMANISINFDQQVQIQEAKLGYAFQNMMEGIHSEVYSLLIQTYVDKDKQDTLFNAIEEIPAVKKKAEWAISWLGNQETSFAQRLIAFACVECIQFSSSFASIAYMGKRGLLPGLSVSNQYIRADEGSHVEF